MTLQHHRHFLSLPDRRFRDSSTPDLWRIS
jgi:hypothetical protein